MQSIDGWWRSNRGVQFWGGFFCIMFAFIIGGKILITYTQ